VAAFFSRSLAPGVYITGPYTGSSGRRGAFNATNTDYSSGFNAGLYGKGPRAIEGIAASDGSTNTSAGFFDNPITFTVNSNYGMYAIATNGWGVYGSSAGNTGSQQSAGVVGVSTVPIIARIGGAGGVFTGTEVGAVGYGETGVQGVAHTTNGIGVQGIADGSHGDAVNGIAEGDNGIGVAGIAFLYANALGGYFQSYDGSNTAVGLHVAGKGTATGGFITGGSYDMMVRYDGTDDLHPGDVLALDGSTSKLDNATLLGTIKADASNSAAIGVAQYRCDVYPVHNPVDSQNLTMMNAPAHSFVQPDTQASSFKSGDIIDIVVLGTAQMKVSGNLKVGDHLTLAGNGSVVAAKGDAESIGKLATLPDKDGYATVFVNFK